jgi:hypothetical protein
LEAFSFEVINKLCHLRFYFVIYIKQSEYEDTI